MQERVDLSELSLKLNKNKNKKNFKNLIPRILLRVKKIMSKLLEFGTQRELEISTEKLSPYCKSYSCINSLNSSRQYFKNQK